VKRVLAGVGVLALTVAVATLAVFLLPRHGGPLDKGGNAFSGPVQAGRPFTANYDLRNNGDRPIDLGKVTLGDHSSGLRLLGARVQTLGANHGGAWPGFPVRRTTSVPVDSYVLGPHGYALLQVGLQADRIGKYRLKGIQVEYRVPYVSRFGRHYMRTVTTLMAVCAQRRPIKARAHLCRAPSIG